MEERSEQLLGRALEIWASPVTEFKPEQKQLDYCSLYDDAHLSGRQIVWFSFKGAEQLVSSWVEMYERVIRLLFELRKRYWAYALPIIQKADFHAEWSKKFYDVIAPCVK